MRTLTAAVLGMASLTLSACGEGGVEPPEGPVDTSFEQAAPNPVPAGGTADEPVPDNTSIVSGPDERADAILDYDGTPPAQETAPVAAD